MNKGTDNKCVGTATSDALLSALTDELERGVHVIRSVDDVTYCRAANGTGSIGGQFRHDLDFVTSLLKGLENGRIDYADRERDVRVETERPYAVGCFERLIGRLSQLDPRVMGRQVMIRSETDGNIWLASSFAREVEFVHSHTVHHHALISEKLAGFGVAVGGNFGVAPSTVEYWRKEAA